MHLSKPTNEQHKYVMFRNQFNSKFIPKKFFCTKFQSFSRIFRNVFGYVRTVPDDFKSNKRLKLMSASPINGVHCDSQLHPFAVDRRMNGRNFALRYAHTVNLNIRAVQLSRPSEKSS